MDAKEKILEIAKKMILVEGELTRLRREYDAVFESGNHLDLKRVNLSTTESISSMEDRDSQKGTLSDRLRGFLVEQAGKASSVREILQAFPSENQGTIRSTLARLSQRSGGVKKAGKGKFCYKPEMKTN